MIYLQKKKFGIMNAIKVWFITTAVVASAVLYLNNVSYAKNVEGTEGICTIHKAKWNGSSPEVTNIPSTYDYVYFGHLDGTKQYTCPTYSPSPAGESYKSSYIKTGPLKFRVLDTVSNNESTEALFLLTEYPIGYRSFHSSGQDWNTSAMRDFLNGETDGCVYKDCFDEVERSAIEKTTKTDKCTNWRGYFSRTYSGTDKAKTVGEEVNCKLNNDRIFLLSTEEALSNRYGFSTAYTDSSKDINRKVDETHTGGMWPGWWLRSAFSSGSGNVACVNSSGYCDYTGSSYTGVCVRCALNIPLSSVLFTSYASDEGASPLLSLIKDRELSESSEFKLTILDNRTDSPRKNFKLIGITPEPTVSGDPIVINNDGTIESGSPIVVSNGHIITIKYQGAVTTTKEGESTLADNEYITAIIRSNDYTVTDGNYYGVLKKITKPEDNQGEVKLVIPEGIVEGDYTVMILNEQINGPYKTNYACKFDIPIRVLIPTQPDTTKPNVVGKAYRNEDNTGFLMKVRDNGILRSIEYGNTPTVVNLKGQEQKINFSPTSAITEFNIYNIGGLYTTVQSSSCIVDNQAPTVIKEEEDFKWKLTIQDSQSGLWKITSDLAGDSVIKDYSGDGYPITQEEFIVPWEYDSVYVWDAVGNHAIVQTNAHEVGMLGYSYIKEPTWSGDYKTATTYNKVYFGIGGSHFTNSSDAIEFRVLDTTANDDNHTPALFMLTEYTTSGTKIWDSRSLASHIWNSSDTVRSYVYNSSAPNTSGTIYNDCFSDEEKKVIMFTTKTEEGDEKWYFNGTSSNPKWYWAGATDLIGEKVFLLSAKEVIDTKYGFSNITYPGRYEGTSNSVDYIYKHDSYTVGGNSYTGDQSRIAKQGGPGGSDTHWWLRSAFSNSSNRVAFVNSSGYCSYNDSNSTGVCVRCALNIPLSSVLMTSYASGASSSTATFSPLSTPTMSATKFKLTIKDETRGNRFSIDEDNVVAQQGGTVTLKYKESQKNSENKTIIMAIIKNGSDAWLANGNCTPKDSPNQNDGTVKFTIPSDSTIPVGTYKMIVYNEIAGTGNQTNTAEYDTLKIKIVAPGTDADAARPSIRNTYKNEDGTCYKVTIDDTGSGISQIESSTKVLNISKPGETVINSITTNIEVSQGSTLKVCDMAGNEAPIELSEITKVDKTPPSYTITYNQGDYIINVSDTESGVWKITDSTGQKILKDWSR